MDINNTGELKDGEPASPLVTVEAPPILEVSKQKFEGNFKKKRRRGKSKRKIIKPFTKTPWQERRKNDRPNRINRFRKVVVAKTQAPFNNNQFLMEIHKPEPENNFNNLRTPSARTRDSSFSVDSEDNFFFSLPENEDEYLTKEFSSVYEDAHSERLTTMSKNELMKEYLMLEAKYETLITRTERSRGKESEFESSTLTDKDASITDRDSMVTDRDTSETSVSESMDESSVGELLQRLKEQDDQIRELQIANEKLRAENDLLRHRAQSSSEDSESDSSSSSDSASSSSRCDSTDAVVEPVNDCEHLPNGNEPETNGEHQVTENGHNIYPIVNGFHSGSD